MRRGGFFLDGIRIEHRALAPRKPFTARLPLPPGADAMFAALPGRGRFATPVYADWQEQAALRLLAAAPPRLKGPVWIAITFEDIGECENRARPVLALLIRERVIEGDASVRELRLTRGAGAGARVEIRTCAFDAAP